MAPGMSAPPPREIGAAPLDSGWPVECFRCPEHRVSAKFWVAPAGETERGSGNTPEPLSTLPTPLFVSSHRRDAPPCRSGRRYIHGVTRYSVHPQKQRRSVRAEYTTLSESANVPSTATVHGMSARRCFSVLAGIRMVPEAGRDFRVGVTKAAIACILRSR